MTGSGRRDDVRDPRGQVGTAPPARPAVLRWLAPVLVVTLMTVSLGWLARAPYQPPGADDAVLRLSWRLRAPATEVCRTRSQAELDALPVHMRAPEVCEHRIAAYDLTVQVDSLPADTTRVVQGGAKGDRPLYVLREIPLEPGRHRVRIRFAAAAGAPVEAHVAPLALDTVLHMDAGAVVLVTLGADTRMVIVRRSTP
jgi:hypothetical protein